MRWNMLFRQRTKTNPILILPFTLKVKGLEAQS